jgi:hypothetical protein
MTPRVRLIIAGTVAVLAAAGPVWASSTAALASEGRAAQDQAVDAPRASPWILFPGDGGALLSQADGEGRETMLMCAQGSGRIIVSNSAFTREATSLTLTSGGGRGVYPLAPEGPDDGSGERKFQIAEIGAGEAILVAFKHTGRMTMEGGGQRISLVIAPENQATVDRFLTYCGG